MQLWLQLVFGRRLDEIDFSIFSFLNTQANQLSGIRRPVYTFRIRVFLCTITAQRNLLIIFDCAHIEIIIFDKSEPFAIGRPTSPSWPLRLIFESGFLNNIFVYDSLCGFFSSNKYRQGLFVLVRYQPHMSGVCMLLMLLVNLNRRVVTSLSLRVHPIKLHSVFRAINKCNRSFLTCPGTWTHFNLWLKGRGRLFIFRHLSNFITAQVAFPPFALTGESKF